MGDSCGQAEKSLLCLQTLYTRRSPYGKCSLGSPTRRRWSVCHFINTARFWWAKLIWSFLLLAAVAAMTLHLWYLFDQWYSYPKTTQVSLGFDFLAFPQVTICNTNPIRLSKLETITGAEQLKSLLQSLEPKELVSEQKSTTFDPFDTTTTSSTPDTTIAEATQASFRKRDVAAAKAYSKDLHGETSIKSRWKRFLDGYDKLNFSYYYSDYFDYGDYYPDYYYDSDNFYDSYDDYYDQYEDAFGTANSFYGAPVDNETKATNTFTKLYMNSTRTERASSGHQISDMLMKCTFNGRECNASHFTLHQTSEYGNCWTISSKQFTVRKPGSKGGLSIQLFLENSEYLGGIAHGYGVRLDLKQRDSYPFPADEGIYVPSGMETDIGLRMLRIKRLGGNYGQCADRRDFKERYKFSYTRRTCQAVCETINAINNCGCYSAEFDGLAQGLFNKTLSICSTQEQEKCLFGIQQKIHYGGLDCKCENPCKEITYIKTVSQRQWPTRAYTSVPLEWVCSRDPENCLKLEEDLKENRDINFNFMKLNIYYEDLNFEDLTEVPQIEIQQFLSDVGGAIGLWIGLSILSLCELFHLVVELCRFCRTRNKNARKVKRQSRNTGSARTISETKSRNRTSTYESPLPEGMRDFPRTNYANATYLLGQNGLSREHERRNLDVYDSIDRNFGWLGSNMQRW